jgi:PAS domain S-box-containing protein/putative nucleotidyltransferase with HDIG domain
MREVAHVQTVLDALNCGAALLDRAGTIVHANPRLRQMMGRASEQIAGRNVREFYDSPAELALIEEALAHADEPREAEFVVPRPDGSRAPVITSARLLPPPLGAYRVMTFIDITAQKAAERDMRENLRVLGQVGDNAIEHAMELKDYSDALERKVRQRTEDLHAANLDAIYMLAVASEAKDADTGRHVRRIQRFAEALARRLGIGERESHGIGYSAVLHDVGKIHVPDEILKKPGPLDDAERFVMKQHTLFGERILSKRPFFERARRIARSHHENWDGSGYPDGLSGDRIPLEARIVRVADVYDALTTNRVYKQAWPSDQAIAFMCESRGTLFDAEGVRAFKALVDSGEIAKLSQDVESLLDL